jgi:hypothetical protein
VLLCSLVCMLLPPSPCAQPHSGAGGLVHSSPTAQVWLAALAQTPQACWGPCEGLLRTPLVIRQIAAMLLRHLTLFVAGYVLCFIVYGFVEGCEGVEKAQGVCQCSSCWRLSPHMVAPCCSACMPLLVLLASNLFAAVPVFTALHTSR